MKLGLEFEMLIPRFRRKKYLWDQVLELEMNTGFRIARVLDGQTEHDTQILDVSMQVLGFGLRIPVERE